MNKPTETAFPPPERGQHDELEHQERGPKGAEVWRVKEPSQIERYYRRGLLGNIGKDASDKQFNEARQMLWAGQKYAKLAYVGCLGPRYTKINMHRIP